MSSIIPMSLLSAGESAEVSIVAGSSSHSKRLGELGLRPGVRVQMVRPGSPCIVRLDGSKLCFRSQELQDVLVQTETAAVPSVASNRPLPGLTA